MNYQAVKDLADRQYIPQHSALTRDLEVKAAVAEIIAEERAKGGTKLKVSQGVRTRISELLQSRTVVPNPQVVPTSDVPTMRRYLDEHREHQNAHFHALWQLADKLAFEGGVQP